MISVEGERYEYEMNVLMTLAKAGIPIEEVPIHTIYQDKNNSGSHFRAVQDSIRIYKDILKFMLSSFSSFILDYVLFSLFMIFLPHTAVLVLAANIAARMISAFYNYYMNCRFVFHAFDTFELKDLSYLNEVDRHIEQSEVWEPTLSRRAFKKPEDFEETILAVLLMQRLPKKKAVPYGRQNTVCMG